MNKTLEGKVALVTGGTTGIGRDAVVALCEAGARVVFTGRREAEGQETARLAQAKGGEVRFIQADATNDADNKRIVDETVREFGQLDIAFNNAGVEILGPITEVEKADYEKVFSLNVWGVLSAMKHEVLAMQKNGSGSIINTSSIAGKIGLAHGAIYIASKHAVEGLTKSAALEYAPDGIRVNAVAPGLIQTDMADRFTGGEGEMRDQFISMHPLGRVGTPKEISDAVVWLAGDTASFVTGHSLLVDGGFTAQ
jgi:NAD(P)-dependent dehydrogenase (short-subunit alcohol dehydrogenase family)